MASVNEIWLVDFGDPYPGEPAHHRLAVVIGPAPVFRPDFPFTIVVPMTTTDHGLALHVEVKPTAHNGLTVTSYAQCELLRSLNRQRLVTRLGSLDLVIAAQVERVIRALLGY
ncbi:MAG: type II toxin-antitoxin system PemK/MazF family toxin [Acidimicrobiales bacterium]